MPPEILDTHQLHRITLDYRRECKHNDVVDSLATSETPYNDEHNNQECGQIHTDKATVNGTVVNGTIVNGRKVNGSSGVLVSRDLEYLHLVRLATNEVEINRARTVWKTKSWKAGRLFLFGCTIDLFVLRNCSQHSTFAISFAEKIEMICGVSLFLTPDGMLPSLLIMRWKIVLWLGGVDHDFWVCLNDIVYILYKQARKLVSEGLPMIILSHLIQSCPHAMIYIMDLLIMSSFIQVSNVIIQWHLLGSLIYYLNLYRTWILIFCHCAMAYFLLNLLVFIQCYIVDKWGSEIILYLTYSS